MTAIVYQPMQIGTRFCVCRSVRKNGRELNYALNIGPVLFNSKADAEDFISTMFKTALTNVQKKAFATLSYTEIAILDGLTYTEDIDMIAKDIVISPSRCRELLARMLKITGYKSRAAMLCGYRDWIDE
jgi:hypothetical protein